MTGDCSVPIRAGIAIALLAAALALPAEAQTQQLSPQEVFKRVSPSVVVIEVREYPEGKPSRMVASGSGVVVPSRNSDETLIATNCHLTDKSPLGAFLIKQGGSSGLGVIYGRDSERDLCLVKALFPEGRGKDGEVTYRKLPSVRIASSQWLEVGDPVYAIGAPQGLELTLSDGLISGIRESKGTEYIQTTAPISKGSSGGGLFDAQGRLVGITTMFLKEGQSLNFAVPAELIASVPSVKDDIDSAEAAAAAAAAETAAAAADAAAAEEERSKTTDRWLKVGEDAAGGNIFVDTKTIMRSGSDVMAWWKIEYKTPQKDKVGDTYDEESTLSNFHCSAQQISSLSKAQRLRGSVVWSHDYKSHEAKRQYAGPETVGEALLEAACGL
jgi:hypothetical protein